MSQFGRFFCDLKTSKCDYLKISSYTYFIPVAHQDVAKGLAKTGGPLESDGLGAPRPSAPRGFIQVNDGKKFDHIKTGTLTGTFKIFIAAGVNPGISFLNYPF